MTSPALARRASVRLVMLLVSACLALAAVAAGPAAGPRTATPSAPAWVTVDYGPLVDRRALSHSGEPVSVLLERLGGRPMPPSGERPSDRTDHVLLDPLLEPYAFVLSDALDALAPAADPPLVEVGSLWQPGEAQPAWVELLRARAMILESDGRGTLRAILPYAGPDQADSAMAAQAAWDAAWPVLRQALAAERRRLAAARVDAPPLHVSVYAFRHVPARTLFELGTVPRVIEVRDTRPRGTRAPLDLAAIQRFLKRGDQLEAARLDRGSLRLIGGETGTPVAILGQPVSLADLAVAYRAVFHGGAGEPYMSLDRGFAPQTSTVNYGGRLRDTALGLTSLLSDVRFKTFSVGIDPVTGRDIRDALRAKIPGFRTHVERFAEDARSANVPGQQTRLWFYPDSVEMLLSESGDMMALRRARMTASAERVDQDLRSASGAEPPWTRATTDAINHDYDDLARQFPELGSLDVATRLLSLFAWLRDAETGGQAVPELDALLGVDLPALSTPRSYPQLLAFNALPPAGNTTRVVVVDRAGVAAGLDRLGSVGARPLAAARRFDRALAALDRRISEQAALARDLEALDRGSLDDALLDAHAYRAERLRMHYLSLAALAPADKDALAKRAKSGEQLRVFSLGIGGLDLGMGAVVARAARRDRRVNLSPVGAGHVVFADGTGSTGAAPRDETPAAAPAEPREDWRRDPPELPATVLPPHGLGSAGPARTTRGARTGEGRATMMIETVSGSDGADARVRRVVLDDSGRVALVERYEDGRHLRYRVGVQGAAVQVQPQPAAPPPRRELPVPKDVPAGLTVLGISGSDDRLPVRVTVSRSGAPTLVAEEPRAGLQRLVLGREADTMPAQPVPLVGPGQPLADAAQVMALLPPGAAQPPWDVPATFAAGEEDSATLAAAVNAWAPGTHAVIGFEAAGSLARWQKAPPAASAVLLLPDDAFPAVSDSLREALVAGWPGQKVVHSTRSLADAKVVVLASAEAPGLLGARVRALASDPALRGKYLAVASFSGPMRRDVIGSVLAMGPVAGLGIFDAPPTAQPARARDISTFGAFLNKTRTQPGRIEDAPGPFLWYF